MRIIRFVASLQAALVLPAALFMTAVLVGAGDPPQYDLARMARRLVLWYSQRTWTLWLLLLALPLVALAGGCATLLRSWNRHDEPQDASRPSLAMIPAPIATLFVAATTAISACIVAIVVLHMLAN